MGAAVRFLNMATFGARLEEAVELQRIGHAAWLRREFEKPLAAHVPRLMATATRENGELRNADEPFLPWRDFVEGDDQLRQRAAFALSQILVVSDDGVGRLRGRPFAMAYYRDVLLRNAFGNYRDLLRDVTFSPAMATYLTYLYNRRGDPSANRLPDENYARELMQLFTIGLVELAPDGEPRRDVDGRMIPTYGVEDVQGLARVFTGFGLKGDRFRFGARAPDAFYSPLQAYPEAHEPGEKAFLGAVVPPGAGPEDSVEIALDALFAHPNVAPFIARQMIQRLVASAPSRGYVARAAAAFETGEFRMQDGTSVGSGRRGDVSALIAAILSDPDALRAREDAPATFGKATEPILRFTRWARAFDVNSADASGERVLADASSPDRFNQHPWRAPSVFNFYRPGYVAPGTATGAAGLTAPELQIATAPALTGYAATIGRYVRDAPNRNADGAPRNYRPDYADELALADDPDALVARLDIKLTGGALQPETRARIVRMMTLMASDDDEDRLAQVRIGVWMVMTAPEFLVQR
ncbi:MAG: DUF1800 family protein [Parvularculaceae bacterium]